MKRFLPLIILLAFAGAAIWRISSPADEKVPSGLIGQPVPAFALAPAVPTKPGLATGDLRGGPRLVNVFASWCAPCIGEAPILGELKAKGIPIDAIAVRDRSEDVAAFLQRHGDPFDRIGADPQSRAQLALGSSGVPETFVIDAKGIIRYQHMGPIADKDVPRMVREWEAAR